MLVAGKPRNRQLPDLRRISRRHRVIISAVDIQLSAPIPLGHAVRLSGQRPSRTSRTSGQRSETSAMSEIIPIVTDWRPCTVNLTPEPCTSEPCTLHACTLHR